MDVVCHTNITKLCLLRTDQTVVLIDVKYCHKFFWFWKNICDFLYRIIENYHH